MQNMIFDLSCFLFQGHTSQLKFANPSFILHKASLINNVCFGGIFSIHNFLMIVLSFSSVRKMISEMN